MNLKSHKDLADHIIGKSVLHLNSLGKDSVLCLEWLTRFAVGVEVTSVFFGFLAPHPEDEKYLSYLKTRYPGVRFIQEPNALEITDIISGVYQLPGQALEYRKLEYNDFDMGKCAKELKEEFACDFICSGVSKYESFARASKFHQKGLLQGDNIYPLGLMSKKDVMSLIKNCGVKLHPCYKTSPSTYDHPSWFKMRTGLLARPEYYETMLNRYPLLALDKYRYEVML